MVVPIPISIPGLVIGIFTVLMVVPITNTNPGIGFLEIKTKTRLGFGQYQSGYQSGFDKFLSSENVIYHGSSLEVRDENPQIWISMNTCPLTLKEICTDIYASRYVRCTSFCTIIC